MTSCKFPQHHETGRSSTSGLALIAVVALVLAVMWIRRHLAELVHWAVLVALVLVAAAVLVLVARVVSHLGRREENSSGQRYRRWSRVSHLVQVRNFPRALWAAARWHHLTRNLGLAYPDKHRQGKIRRPRAIVRPGSHGITARVRTVPGSGRAEFDQASQHIADYWRVSRVSVSQPGPGRLVVRGLKVDPLLQQFNFEAAGIQDVKADNLNIRRLYLGRDEHGTDRFADLANCPGIVLGGMPGSGKSTEITSWLAQLAPSGAVQFALADGKNAGEFDDFADRAWAMAGDDLDEVIDLLEKQHGLMTDRLAAVRPVLGVKNAWHRGPSESWPLAVTVLDECQSYLDLTAVKGDKQLEPKVRRCIFLTSSLIRRGRSVMMLTIPATQKPTTDSLPSSIRDNCPVSLCFGVKTIDAAAATLGTEIRRYESYSPVTLADPAYAGCCTATLKSGTDPFTRLRGPWVGEVQAAEVASASAHLKRDPRTTLPVVVPDSPAELVTS